MFAVPAVVVSGVQVELNRFRYGVLGLGMKRGLGFGLQGFLFWALVPKVEIVSAGLGGQLRVEFTVEGARRAVLGISGGRKEADHRRRGFLEEAVRGSEDYGTFPKFLFGVSSVLINRRRFRECTAGRQASRRSRP